MMMDEVDRRSESRGGARRPSGRDALVALLLLALISAGAWLRVDASQSRYGPNAYQQEDVHRYYVSPAESLLAGRGWVTDYQQNFIPPPLQGVFVLAVKSVLPDASYGTIRRLQAWIGALAIALAFGVGLQMRDAWVGLLAAALVAFDPEIVQTASSLLTESNYLALLFGFLCVLLLALRGRRAWLFAAAGALLGLTSLMKPFPTLLAVAIPGYLLLRERKRAQLLRAALFLAGFVVCVAPWIAYNHAKTGELHPISTNGGTLLAASNFRELDARRMIFWERTRKMSGWRSQEIEERYRDKLDENGRRQWNQRDRLYARHALRYIASHPLHFARNYLFKLYNAFRHPLGKRGVWAPRDVYRLASMLLGFAGLAWFAAAERNRPQWLLLWIFGYFAAFTALFHITMSGRINLPLRTLLSFFAAYFLVRLAAFIRHATETRRKPTNRGAIA